MDYDAIVVGTGFGGTIAASRLVQQGKSVLMLERGAWWITPETLGVPGPLPANGKTLRTYLEERKEPLNFWARPDHEKGLLDLFAAMRHSGNPRGLYQYSMFKQAHILTASGVGGGSLIYSNVNMRPKDEVLQSLGLHLGDAEYQDAQAWMEQYRGRLSRIVTKIPLPGRDVADLDKGNPPADKGKDDYLYLDRSRALRDAAKAIKATFGIEAPWSPLDLSIIDYDGSVAGDAGGNHTFCERQGRCILGCLPAARHTLNKTLYGKFLSKPNPGVTLWPLAEVRQIEMVSNGYRVAFRDHRDDREKTVQAPMVFLAGGTLGTTEVLLRSREQLPLGDTLGSNFSTNGDFGAFVYRTTHPVYSTRGPINTCDVRVNFKGSHITIEDCAIPSMFAAIASSMLGVIDKADQLQLEEFRSRMTRSWESRQAPDLRDLVPRGLLTRVADGIKEFIPASLKNILPLWPKPGDATRYQTEAEMVSNIFFFNVMGQDDASGRFRLDHDRLDLDWPKPIADHPVFAKIEDLLNVMAKAMGGRYIPLPTWDRLMHRKLVVTHPLGGCPIGETSADGVVDEFGRVFDGRRQAGPKETLKGLYVIDGSSIPGALAANPSLTIAAQALKAVKAALP